MLVVKFFFIIQNKKKVCFVYFILYYYGLEMKAQKKTQSVEPNIADLANGWMKEYKLDYKLEQESLNTEIDKALSEYFSKNGGA